MPRYLVERTLFANGSAAPVGRIAACRDAVIRANSLEGVTWIHSFVTPDGCRSYCIVDSPSPEAIRAGSRATVLPVDRITEVRVLDPYVLP